MVNFSFLFFSFRGNAIFPLPPTPPSLHAGCIRAMVGHLKFRVFPPFPFAAIHCRQTTINNAVRKRKRHLCFFTTFLTVTPCKRRRKPIRESRAEAELGRSSFFFSFLLLCVWPYRVLDVRIVPFISPDNEKLQWHSLTTRGLLETLAWPMTTIIKGFIQEWHLVCS